MQQSIKLLNTLMFLVLSMFLLSGCTEKTESNEQSLKKESTKALVSIEYIVAKEQKIPVWKRYSGKTKASNEQIVMSRTKGWLTKVYFEDGQMVKKGDKLYEIEGTTLKAKLKEAKAKLQTTHAKLKLARADKVRYLKLSNEGLVPKQKYEQVKTRYDTLLAQRKMDEAIVEERQTDIDYATIVAPISGRISRNLVDVGNLVGSNGSAKLTTIIQTDPIYAYFSPSEEEMQMINKYRMQKNLEALITIPTKNKKMLKDRKFRGKVNFESNSVDLKTSTITSRATFSNPDNTVLPGTFVYVNVLVTNKFELVVTPSESVFKDQIGEFVYVINDEDIIEKKYIELGYDTREFKVLRSGVKIDERIVVSGFVKLRVGTKVKAVNVDDTKGVMAILKKNNLLHLD